MGTNSAPKSLLTGLCMQSEGVFQNPAPEPPPHCSSLQHFSSVTSKDILHHHHPAPRQKSYWRPYLAYPHLSFGLILCHTPRFLFCDRIWIFFQFFERSKLLPVLTLLHVSSSTWLSTLSPHSPTCSSDLSLVVISLGMIPLIRSNYTVYVYVHCSLYRAFILVVTLYLDFNLMSKYLFYSTINSMRADHGFLTITFFSSLLYLAIL